MKCFQFCSLLVSYLARQMRRGCGSLSKHRCSRLQRVRLGSAARARSSADGPAGLAMLGLPSAVRAVRLHPQQPCMRRACVSKSYTACGGTTRFPGRHRAIVRELLPKQHEASVHLVAENANNNSSSST